MEAVAVEVVEVVKEAEVMDEVEEKKVKVMEE